MALEAHEYGLLWGAWRGGLGLAEVVNINLPEQNLSEHRPRRNQIRGLRCTRWHDISCVEDAFLLAKYSFKIRFITIQNCPFFNEIVRLQDKETQSTSHSRNFLNNSHLYNFIN